MKEYRTFTSLAVKDLVEAKAFYKDKLKLDEISLEDQGVLMFHTGGETRFMIYKKEDHVPADFTVLNFAVEDLDSLLEELSGSGLNIEKLDRTDEKGVAEMGPVRAAWTRDPGGNWIGFFQQAEGI